MRTSSGTLLFITGASRGIGQACAIACVQSISKSDSFPLVLYLIARSKDGLQKTAALVKQAIETNKSKQEEEQRVHVFQRVVDLSNVTTLDDKMTEIFHEMKCRNNNSTDDKVSSTGHDGVGYERAIFINNAGSLGPVGCSSTELTKSLDNLRKAIDLNVTSSIWLSSNFIKHFSASPNTKCTVVNMSSLCAIEPFKTLGTYCAGKAARDMFHTVIAKEFQHKPNVKFLNYAPGVVESKMTYELSQSETLDDELSAFYKTATTKEEEGGTSSLQPSATAKRLVDLIIKDDFTSGKHIDYWDIDQS